MKIPFLDEACRWVGDYCDTAYKGGWLQLGVVVLIVLAVWVLFF